MNISIKLIFVLFMILSIVSCTSAPERKQDTGNSAQSQKLNAKQAQDELSSEVTK